MTLAPFGEGGKKEKRECLHPLLVPRSLSILLPFSEQKSNTINKYYASPEALNCTSKPKSVPDCNWIYLIPVESGHSLALIVSATRPSEPIIKMRVARPRSLAPVIKCVLRGRIDKQKRGLALVLKWAPRGVCTTRRCCCLLPAAPDYQA